MDKALDRLVRVDEPDAIWKSWIDGYAAAGSQPKKTRKRRKELSLKDEMS